jgi:hypothetical protein
MGQALTDAKIRQAKAGATEVQRLESFAVLARVYIRGFMAST